MTDDIDSNSVVVPFVSETAEDLPGKAAPEKTPSAEVLLGIAEKARLFHMPDGTAYADIRVGDHRETWPVRTKGFKSWLTYHFYRETLRAPNSDALQNAINTIEAKARFEGDERNVSLRTAAHGDTLYIDLGDKAWRSVAIDARGWQIIDAPEVRFRRAPGLLPLAEPVRGGSIDLLKQFLNVQHKEQFTLAVAWLLAALKDSGPYPVLGITGEQGSAKSTTTRMLRELIDPNKSPIRSMPRESDDLYIAANNGYVIAFDNVSGLPHWLSDDLCRLATGGGFSKRQLYTDQDEILFDAMRPVILNGIEDMVERPDLTDRTMFIALEHILKTKRKPEKELWADFGKAAPYILGALLDAAAVGIQRRPHVFLEELPRMADFALWVTACEAAIWKSGTFMQAYVLNADEACSTLIEGDLVANAMLEYMHGKAAWTGTTEELLKSLDHHVGETWARKREWPKTPRSLSGRLKRLAPMFRARGLLISKLPREADKRSIQAVWVGGTPS